MTGTPAWDFADAWVFAAIAMNRRRDVRGVTLPQGAMDAAVQEYLDRVR